MAYRPLTNIVPQPQQEEEKGILRRAIDDVKSTVGNYVTGAIQGNAEVDRQNQTLNSMYQTDENGRALTDENGAVFLKPEYTQNDFDYALSQRNKATQTLNQETIKPTVELGGAALAPFTGGASLLAAAPLIAGDLGKTAVDAYQDTEGNALQKTGNAVRSVTYGPLADQLTDPNLSQKFHDRPISTLAEGALNTLQAVAPLEAGRRGIVRAKGKVEGTLENINKGLPEEGQVKPYQTQENIGLPDQVAPKYINESVPPEGLLRSKLREIKQQAEPPAQVMASPAELVKQAEGVISFGDKPSLLNQAAAAIREPKKAADNLINSGKATWDKVYTAMVDRLDPINEFTKQVEKATGEQVPFEQNPYKQARLAVGRQQYADLLIERGDPSKGIRAYKDIIKEVGTKQNEFSTYVTARRIKELRENGIEQGMTPEQVNAVIKNASPEFHKTHAELMKYNNGLLDYLHENGMVSPEAYAAMKKYENYAPLNKEFDEAGFDAFIAGKAFGNVKSPIKKIGDSQRTIINPLENIIKNTYLFANRVERNRVAQTFTELAKKPGMEGLLQEVKGPADAKQSIFGVMVNGKQKFYETTPELYRALQFLDRESAGFVAKIFQAPTNALRAGATLTPDFMARNLFRDNVSAYVYEGINPIQTTKGVWEAIKYALPKEVKTKLKLDDSLMQQWIKEGGAQSALVSLDRNNLQNNLRSIIQKPMYKKAITVFNPMAYVRVLQSLSEFSEQSTRLGLQKKLVKEGTSPAEAAYRSRDLMDFGRSGYVGKEVNKVVAFFNAAIQGTDKMVRVFKENPAKFTTRATTAITLPSIALYMMNRNDERYQRLAQWQKDMFWIIPTSYSGAGWDGLVRIPKPFELGILFGTVPERFLEYVDKKNPQILDSLINAGQYQNKTGIKAESVLKRLGKNAAEGIIPSFVPTAVLPVLEWWANKSTLTGMDIVPQREEKLPDKLQAGPYTTTTAKKIGETLDVSPRKVDNTIRGYTGGLGNYVTQGIDLASGAYNTRPTVPVADYPGIRAFTANSGKSSQAVQDLYDEYKKQDQLYNEGKLTKQKPQEFNPAKYRILKDANEELSKLKKSERDILNSSDSPETKRSKLDAIAKYETGIVEKALKRIK
jgi:hypothetical protein